MFGKSNVPKWVKDLPSDDSNRELLIKIARASRSPLEAPRDIVFSIKDIKGLKGAQSVVQYCQQQGWVCEVSKDHRNGDFYWVEAKKNDYVIEPNRLSEDEHLFMRLAHMNKALYDGWYASVV